MAEVRLRHLVKRFGAVAAVDDLSLEIRDGELMVFLGPSGCGKTTTLRAIAGLEQVRSGEILIGDRRVNALSPADRDIAFVFQFYALYPHLNVYDNIAFPLRAQHTPAPMVEERVRSIARILRMEPLLGRRIRQLSSGEQQRVALGRALIRRPQVLLMDEPLTNLDAMLRGEMRAELKHLQRQHGITTIYVTHDQVEAMALGDRITVMNAGRVQQVGTPLEVYRRPGNLFVAGFIGTPPMSLIPCALERRDGRLLAARATFRVVLPERVVAALAARPGVDQIIVGVRPEAVRLQSSTYTQDEACPAVVYAVEPLGDENIIDLRLGTVALRARTAPAVRPRVDDQLMITVAPDQAHVFDAETGEAIGAPAASPSRHAAEVERR